MVAGFDVPFDCGNCRHSCYREKYDKILVVDFGCSCLLGEKVDTEIYYCMYMYMYVLIILYCYKLCCYDVSHVRIDVSLC